MPLSDEQIADTLTQYGVESQAHLCDQIRIYISILLNWNRRISLTTVTNEVDILEFHFGESFFAAQAVPIGEGRLADVGSGAGFPGLAIRLVAAGLDCTLIESNTKRATFLSEVVRSLHLDNVTVFRGRMEELSKSFGEFDFVTARAVGRHELILDWARERLASRGKIVLWIGQGDVDKISNHASWTWRSPIRIPGSHSRFLLVGSPA